MRLSFRAGFSRRGTCFFPPRIDRLALHNTPHTAPPGIPKKIRGRFVKIRGECFSPKKIVLIPSVANAYNAGRGSHDQIASDPISVAIIAIALLTIALRPYIAPAPVAAQSSTPYPFYFEPGTQMLRAPDGSRQVYGRMVVDLRTGKVWGFPTFTADTYPVNVTGATPPTSHPFLLARFAMEEMQ